MARRRASKEYTMESPPFVIATTPELDDDDSFVPETPPVDDEICIMTDQDMVHAFRRRLQLESMQVADVDDVILTGIDGSNDASMAGTFYRAKLAACKDDNFKQLISRVEMNYRTLRFNEQYEQVFCHVLHRSAIRRIRYTLMLGFVSVLAKNLYGWHSTSSPSRADKMALGLGLGISLPCILGAFACTFVEAWTMHCERYSSLAFIVVTCELTAEKLILAKPGPILPLFICFVPVFGITRLRFDVCWKLVAITIAFHVTALLCAGQENVPDIFFQGFSYLGAIVGGAVAHYRVEVLRRRNFALHLPFCAASFDKHQLFCDMKTPWTSKHALLERYSLRFKNRQIEAAFNRYWYLIDGSPFQNVYTSTLHRNAARSIRYAVQGTFFQQLLLAIQDYRSVDPLLGASLNFVFSYIFLPEPSPHPTYWVTVSLRVGVVSTYFGAQCLMWRYGQRYSSYWERHKSKHESEPLTKSAPTQSLPTNYVSKMQLWSALIVFFHALSMGLVLVLFDGSGINSGVAAPCYYLALLNAILFPHRSGFRVRFLFATISTSLLSLVFAVICASVVPSHFLEYTTYVGVTLALGMMISHEEESLRRAFFVRRAIRSHEFDTWYRAVMTIRPYIQRKIATKRIAWKRHHTAILMPLTSEVDMSKQDRQKANKIPTSNLLATASKYGMYFDVTQAIVAACILAAYLS
ncbi:unnamed protein product [Aphanomyces euteiches]